MRSNNGSTVTNQLKEGEGISASNNDDDGEDTGGASINTEAHTGSAQAP